MRILQNIGYIYSSTLVVVVELGCRCTAEFQVLLMILVIRADLKT